MKKLFASCVLLAVGFTAALLTIDDSRQTQAAAVKAKPPMIAHSVYLSLKENSSASKQKLVAACKEYLGGHDGTIFFATGERDEDAKGGFTDTDYDVALIIAFQDKASLKKYAKSSRHLQFIGKYGTLFSKVRVFDATFDRIE